MTDEEYVRANWEDDLIWSLSSGAPANHELWDTERWAAAAEYTRERLEQIRQLEEEIELLGNDTLRMRRHVELHERELITEYVRWCRILARLETALADLKRGMANPTCPSLTDPAATP